MERKRSQRPSYRKKATKNFATADAYGGVDLQGPTEGISTLTFLIIWDKYLVVRKNQKIEDLVQKYVMNLPKMPLELKFIASFFFFFDFL